MFIFHIDEICFTEIPILVFMLTNAIKRQFQVLLLLKLIFPYRPNYNVSFNMSGGGGSKNNNVNNGNGQAKNNGSSNTTTTSGGGSKKVSSNTFEDLLGQNFSFTPSSSTFNNANTNKSIGEMKKAETMKQMTAEEAQVFAWKDGKSRNLRALLCSLHTECTCFVDNQHNPFQSLNSNLNLKQG